MSSRFFSQIFNIRPGEWTRFLILYSIALLFFTGITWGETIIEAAFLHEPGLGVEQLPLVFTLHAIVQILSTALYVAVVDRVANDRLLIIISAFSALAIALGVFLLEINQEVFAYLALYVLVRVIRGVFTLHWWTYVSDYYDTQAAKRIVPVLNSVVRIGIIIASLSMPLLAVIMPPIGIIILWMLSMVAVGVVVWMLPHLIKRRRKQVVSNPSPITETVERGSYIQNIREGYSYVAQSPFLGWMALATLLMVVIFAILNTQPSATLRANLPTVAEYSSYIGIINGIAGLILLPVQLFLFNRLITRLGVGATNLLFPLSTAVISGFLLALPTNLSVAGLAYLDRTAVRLAIREPSNNLLFNAVPIRIKGRARAFIDGLIVPVGLLLGSGLLLIVPQIPVANFVLWVLVILAIAYLISSLIINRLYGKALISTLEQEDFSLVLTLSTEEPTVSADMLKLLTQKLEESKSPDLQVFIARMIMDAGGSDVLASLKQIAQSGDNYLRSAIVEIVRQSDIRTDTARQFFNDFITDPDPQIRRQAVAGLENVLEGQEKQFLPLAYNLLQDPSLEVRAQVVPALLRSKDMFYVTSAAPMLGQLMEDVHPERQIQGIRMLKEIPDARFITRLLNYLKSPNDQVRLEAVLAIQNLAHISLPEAISKQVVGNMVETLKDPFENVRQAALNTLGLVHTSQANQILIQELLDPSESIRQIAVESLTNLGKPVIPLLNQYTENGSYQLSKMATVVLGRIQPQKYSQNLQVFIDNNLRLNYRTYAYLQVLAPCREFSGMALLCNMLNEQNNVSMAEVFYLIAAVHGNAVKVIAESLRSPSKNIHANAVEALESLVGTQTAKAIGAFFDKQLAPSEIITMGEELWDETYPTPQEIIRGIVKTTNQPWQRMAAGFGLAQIAATLPDKPELNELNVVDLLTPRRRKSNPDLLGALISSDDSPKKGKSKIDPLAAIDKITAPTTPELSPCQTLFTYREIQSMVQSLADDAHEEIYLVGRVAGRLMQGSHLDRTSEEERGMLTAIEKILFLKEVSFFKNMSVEQLKVLATVCEEQVFDAESVIFTENDPGDALYVIIQGRVAIEREDERKESITRLALLEDHAYFGEMTLFNGSPRSTRAVALKKSLLLRLRREPLVALIRQYPDLSLELINILSDRLREANDQIVQLTKSKPKELHKLYDKLDL